MIQNPAFRLFIKVIALPEPASRRMAINLVCGFAASIPVQFMLNARTDLGSYAIIAIVSALGLGVALLVNYIANCLAERDGESNLLWQSEETDD